MNLSNAYLDERYLHDLKSVRKHSSQMAKLFRTANFVWKFRKIVQYKIISQYNHVTIEEF